MSTIFDAIKSADCRGIVLEEPIQDAAPLSKPREAEQEHRERAPRYVVGRKQPAVTSLISEENIQSENHLLATPVSECTSPEAVTTPRHRHREGLVDQCLLSQSNVKCSRHTMQQTTKVPSTCRQLTEHESPTRPVEVHSDEDCSTQLCKSETETWTEGSSREPVENASMLWKLVNRVKRFGQSWLEKVQEKVPEKVLDEIMGRCTTERGPRRILEDCSVVQNA